MNIFGISPEHDSSSCLLKNGEIEYFMKEERITRIKRDKYPTKTSKFIFNNYDIDYIAWCPPRRNNFLFNKFAKESFNGKDVIDVYDFSDKHHLCHASLAFYNSGFEEAAVLVIDRNGSEVKNSFKESESIFKVSYPHNFTIKYKNYWLNENVDKKDISAFKKNKDYEIDLESRFGIVKVYETATSLIGQNALENGKTMGLAAYGIESNINSLFLNNTNIPNDIFFDHKTLFNTRVAINKSLDKYSITNVDKNNYQIYANYAYHVQQQTQDAVCRLIEKAIKLTDCKNICISGGYGLNVVANYYYMTQFPNINFYFEPISDDSGNSIGASFYVHRLLTNDMSIKPLQHTFFNGHDYDISHIHGDNVSIKDIAKLISDGKSVAVYNQKSEAGPRALGNRSIFFNPAIKDSKDIVNKIKKREWYRPFAAMVLEEDAHIYFNLLSYNKNNFMTVSYPATEYAIENIPGVLHVDNTCRIQTVSVSDGYLYLLLNEVKILTGHGVVLNTSFNLAGEPLVETPEDAIKTLKNSSLDYVWFVEKSCVIN